MKRDIIFADEMINLGIFVLPETFPFSGMPFFGGRDITNGGIHPDIKNQIFVSLKWHRYTPLKIPGDTSWL